MSTTLRNAGSFLLAGVLTAGLSGVPLGASAATPGSATDTGPSTVAGKWLNRELTGGLMVGKFGPDYGLTIDTGLALASAGDKIAVRKINAALEPKLGDYIGSDKEIYGGATAKAAVFARAATANPTSYGGVNLITRLEGQVADIGTPGVGRLSDTSEYGDFANVVGQSYAVRALSVAGSKEAEAATSFLLTQQCTGGYFRLNFNKPADATQGCVDGAAGSEADPDATALAVINLVESRDKSALTQESLAKAGAWLAAKQRGSGAFRGGTSTKVVNTNTTSLAGYALGLLNNRDAALRAATWVRRNQPIDKSKCRSALTKDLGAVAYRGPKIGDARTGGITDEARDEWRRSTAQAVQVLQYAPAPLGSLRITAARKNGQAGNKLQFRAYGVAPGERACMQMSGDFKRIVGKRSGNRVARRLQLPTGNRKRVAIVKTADDVSKVWVRVRN